MKSIIQYLLLSTVTFFFFNTASMAQSYSFPIVDFPIIIDGEQLKEPFIGGFNNPQPQQINLNNDDILDLVVYDRDIECVKTFIGREENGEIVYDYSPRYEYIFPKAVNFILVKDFNQDGVEDLFVGYNETGVPGIHVYRGSRDRGELSFKLMEFKNREDNLLTYRSGSSNYYAINTSPIDLPAIADVDNDGDIDILTFQPGMGNVFFLKNMAMEKGLGPDTIDLVLGDLCYGKFYESDFGNEISLSPSPNKCAENFMEEASLRHAGSTIASLDLDGDGLSDVLIGDMESNRVVALYNGGTQDNAWMIDQDITFPSYDRPIDIKEFLSIFTLDVDQDGKTDLVIAPNIFMNAATRNNMHVYRQVEENGKPAYTFYRDDFLYNQLLDMSSHAVPVTADINGDGLVDIIVGTYGDLNPGTGRSARLYYFENTGTAENPEFTLKDDDFLNMSQFGEESWGLSPTFGDLDGDGDLDLIVGDYQGYLHYFENIAGPGKPMEFAEIKRNYMGLKVSYYAMPQIYDVNGDGLGDIIVGEQNGNSGPEVACGSIVYFQNQGTIGSPHFNSDGSASPNTKCFGNVFTRYLTTSRAYTSPQLVNVNGEMRLITGDYQGNISYYSASNDPYDQFELVQKNIAKLNTGRFVHPHLVNLDNDDFYELIVGTLGGGLIIYKTNWKVNGEISSRKQAISSDFNLYPNPAGNSITVEWSEPFVSELQIFNASGVQVLEMSDVETFVKCDISHLPNGVYIVRIKNRSQILSKKLIIQR